MSIRIQSVRLQDVDKPSEVAKLLNEVFGGLRELEEAIDKMSVPEVQTPKSIIRRKGKKS